MNMLLSFAPFVAFALLAGRAGFQTALVVAAAISALLMLREKFIRRRNPKLLEIGSLLLFGLLAIIAAIPAIPLSIIGVRLAVDAGLLAIVLVSVLIGKPFTLQYAREGVTPQIAAHPEFMKANVRLSLIWAAAFAVMCLADLAMILIPGFTAPMVVAANIAALATAGLVTARAIRAGAQAQARLSGAA